MHLGFNFTQFTVSNTIYCFKFGCKMNKCIRRVIEDEQIVIYVASYHIDEMASVCEGTGCLTREDRVLHF